MEMEKRRGRERAQWNTVTGKVRERERGETEDKTERGGRERERRKEIGERREKRDLMWEDVDGVLRPHCNEVEEPFRSGFGLREREREKRERRDK